MKSTKRVRIKGSAKSPALQVKRAVPANKSGYLILFDAMEKDDAASLFETLSLGIAHLRVTPKQIEAIQRKAAAGKVSLDDVLTRGLNRMVRDIPTCEVRWIW